MPTYVRFVIATKDENSGKRKGLFQAHRELRDAGLLNKYEEDQLVEIRDWFNANLAKPDTFTTSSKPHAKGGAISWFKDSAREHLAKMHQFAATLEDHGIHVHVLRTSRPGYVVFEDQFQVTAEPYADTPT